MKALTRIYILCTTFLFSFPAFSQATIEGETEVIPGKKYEYTITEGYCSNTNWVVLGGSKSNETSTKVEVIWSNDFNSGSISLSRNGDRIDRTEKCDNLLTDPITITIKDSDIEGNKICCDQQFDNANTPNSITQSSGSSLKSITGSTLSYEWKSSTDNNNYTTVPNATNETLTFSSPISSTTYYKRIVKTSYDNTIHESNVVKITIGPVNAPVGDLVLDGCLLPFDPVGNSTKFDGVDDRIKINLPFPNNFYTSKSWRLEFWIKTDDYSRNQTLFSITNKLQIGLEGKKLYIKRTDQTSSTKKFSPILQNIQNNSWTHVVINVSSWIEITKFQINFKAYVNRSSVINTTEGVVFNLNDNNEGFIGYETNTPAFKGSFREVKFWNSSNPACHNLLSHWRLDNLCNVQFVKNEVAEGGEAMLGTSQYVESSDPILISENVPSINFKKDDIIRSQNNVIINGELNGNLNAVVIQAVNDIKMVAPSSLKPNIALKISSEGLNECSIPPLKVDLEGPTSLKMGESGTWIPKIANSVSNNYTYSWQTSTNGGNDWYSAGSGSSNGATMTNIPQGIRWRVTVQNGSQIGSSSMFVACSNCTSTASPTQISLNVAPNPSIESFEATIVDTGTSREVKAKSSNGEKVLYRLYDSYGNVIYSKNSTSKLPVTINTSGIKEGIYILTAEMQSGISRKTVVVKR